MTRLPPDEPGSASGLDPAQLDAADLQALHAAVHFAGVTTAIAPPAIHSAPAAVLAGGGGIAARPVELGAASLRTLKLRIAPLPQRPRMKRLRPLPPALGIRRDERIARALPVRRRALLPSEITAPLAQALHAALAAHLGADAAAWRIAAVFPHVPPEAAGAVGVDAGLRSAAFTLPAGLPVHKARAGFYLIVLTGAGDTTRKLLLRL